MTNTSDESAMTSTWKVLESYGRLQKVTEGYRRLWKAMEGHRTLQKVTESCRKLWKVLEGTRKQSQKQSQKMAQ